MYKWWWLQLGWREELQMEQSLLLVENANLIKKLPRKGKTNSKHTKTNELLKVFSKDK